MRALNHKLFRELWRLRGQVVAIGMVVGSGVAVLVMSLSTLEALDETANAYYESYRFGDVFASATRVPDRIGDRIAALPGVLLAETRITRYATLDIPDFPEPVIGRLTSIPASGQPQLNQLALRSGRWLDADGRNEVLVNEPFAEAHDLQAGDEFSAIINGRKRTLNIVGTALSPEFIYALGPGSLLPDDARFGIVWMSRDSLAAAYDLKNAFNDVSVALTRGTMPERVMAGIDELLAPYGGTAAYPRADQLSNWFVMNEIEQLRAVSTLLPVIFLSVAAFLSYMVLTRLIATERSEIGLFKAFGYSDWQVAWHYTKFVVIVAALGSVVGWVVGGAFGRYNTELYADLFRFPLLIFRPSPEAFLIAGSVSLLATLGGALVAVRRAIKLPPAEAMRPPAPASYRRSRLADQLFARWLDQPTRIALRQIARWPVRAALTVAGVALSIALLVMALQWNDSIELMAQSYFFEAQHQSMSVGMTDAKSTAVEHSFEQLPGVLKTEGMRIEAAEFSSGNRRHRGAIEGIAANSVLQPIYDNLTERDLTVPPAGLLLGSFLADKLGVSVGDQVWVDILEGKRPSGFMTVAGTFDTLIGMPAYMDLDALNAWLGTRPSVEYVNLLVDPRTEAELFAELKSIPTISAVMLRRAAIDAFYSTLAENMLVFVGMFTGFACALGFGVAYNSTRIALSERGRELATLRVLGFTRGEISYILLGEVALLIIVALPLGCLAGRALTSMMDQSFQTELYRMPFTISPLTYGLAILFALLATTASAALVRRRINHLDLIRVLKTRE